ncbi:MAG: ATP-binding cassette domain-containing protein [Christensenellaceae bacterium]
MRDAAETAQAARFVEKLEDGYETVVGERGLGLSGGQKQRLSVARALMKRAPVLILDDASSALDMATEKKLLKAVKEKTPENTLLIAAHRVSSVMDCDEIVYLQDGEIVERGTAKELISLGGRFASIYRMQTADGQLDDSSYGKED